MATVFRMFKLEHYLAVVALIPMLWALGHIAPMLTYNAGAFHAGVLQNPVVYILLLLQSVAIVTALVVGFLAAYFARALGHAAIRTLVTPTQAQVYALLATASIWVAFTGLSWASFRQSDLLIAIWYVLAGAAQGLFGAVWLLLAVRAAASLRKFSSALSLFAAAESCFVTAVGALVLLVIYMDNVHPAPSLALFGLQMLVTILILVVPPAITVTAGAALWSGILASRGAATEHGTGDATPPFS